MDTTNQSSPTPSQNTKVRNPLHALPTELRVQIFKPLCTEWDGKIPSIIKALRGDWRLYYEALEVLYESNSYIFHKGNAWSFGDMTKKAVKNIRKVRIIVEPGIMHQGLWTVRHPDADVTTPPKFSPATICDATNIRHLVVEFISDRETEDIIPFTAFGHVTFSLNYFISPFNFLKRVEMVMPRRSLMTQQYVILLREKKLNFGIKGVNSKLGVVGRLESVIGFCEEGGEEDEDDDEELGFGMMDEQLIEWDLLADLETMDKWFWEAGEGCFLGDVREERVLASLGSAMEDLEVNPWRN